MMSYIEEKKREERQLESEKQKKKKLQQVQRKAIYKKEAVKIKLTTKQQKSKNTKKQMDGICLKCYECQPLHIL